MHERLPYIPNDLNPAPKIISVSYSKDEHDMFSMPHAHKVSELIFICDGAGDIQTFNGLIPVEKNDIIIISPNTLHTEISCEQEMMSYYICVFDNLSFTKIENSDCEEEKKNVLEEGAIKLSLSRKDGEETLSIFSEMFKELQNAAPYNSTVVTSLFNLLLVKLIRTHKLTAKVSYSDRQERSYIVHYAKSYVDSYYNTNYSVGDLLDKLKTSYSTLYHNFKKELGVSPMEYRINKQLEESKSMLINSDLRIMQICISIGFSNAAYFSKLFKNAYGLTPKQYREKHKINI